jgi:hypothetical protein
MGASDRDKPPNVLRAKGAEKEEEEWILLGLGIFRTELKNSQIGSGFKTLPLN